LAAVEWWEEFYADPDFLPAVNFPSPKETEGEILFLDGVLRPRRVQRVLDLGCGYGRHAIPLAELQYWVVGLDYSAFYLAEARRGTRGLRGRICFLRADMRKPPFASASFDAVLSMLTTFGFFSTEAEDKALLASIHRVLTRQGIVILDVANRDFLARYFVNGEHHWLIPHAAGGYLENHYYLDEGLGQISLQSLLTREGKVIRKSGFCIHLYSLRELSGMLRGAGFDIAGVWGNYQGDKYEPLSPRMILVGQKCSRE